jgi:MFS family permease
VVWRFQTRVLPISAGGDPVLEDIESDRMDLGLDAVRRFNRQTWLLIASSAIIAAAFFGIYSLLRVLFVLRLGHGPEYVGLFSAAGALTYMTMGLPSGMLSRRFGVGRVMVIGGLITVAGMASLPLTEYLPAPLQNVWPIATQAFLIAGWSMYNVNLVPALMSVTTKEERSSAYAVNGMLKGIGTFVGTTVGGMLPGFFVNTFGLALDAPRPYGYGIWVGVLVGLAALAPVTRLGELEGPETTGRAEADTPFPLLPVALMLVYVYLSHSVWAITRAFSSAYMDTVLSLPAAQIGLITSVGQFLAILSPLVTPWLAQHRGNGWALVMSTAGMGLSLLPMAFFPHWTAVGLGNTGVLALAAIRMPALQVFQMELVDTRWRALAYGALSMAMGFSFATFSFSGGYIAAAFGYRTLYLLGTGLSVAGATLMWFIIRRRAD